MIQGPVLKKGDTVALVSPAKAIDEFLVMHAKNLFEKQEFNVIVSSNATNTYRYFSGTDEVRLADFQWAIDDPSVKAIVCNRGGYGSVRLLEQLNAANLLREPKWILGFSDVTYFHCLGQQLGFETAHTTMPLNFAENTPQALESMFHVLFGKNNEYQWESLSENKLGEVVGKVIVGNLSLFYALLGTPLCPNFEDAIWVIEDVGEQLYHLDRMLWSFKMAGVFDQIAGLIVGGMTDLKDTAVPTEWKVEELVLQHVKYRQIPVAFNAPVGHINDNRAFINGRKAHFEVTSTKVLFQQ